MKLGFCDGCSHHSIRTLQTALAALQNNPEGLPRLDAWLAAQVADPKHLKGEFGVSAQAFVERAHAIGVLPSGRALLAMLSKRFRVDRIRGATVSQQTFLAIQLEGFSQQHLQTLRERVEFCYPFSPDAWPAENTMLSWLYAKLKHCRLLSRSIDKIKDSSQGSVKRTFNWLWTQLIEHLDELRKKQTKSQSVTLLSDQRLRERQPQRKKGTTNLNHLSQQILLLPQSPKRKERVPKARKEKGKVKVKEKGKQEIQRIRMGSQRRQEEVKARTLKVKVRASGRHNPRKPPFHVCFSQKGPVTGVRNSFLA